MASEAWDEGMPGTEDEPDRQALLRIATRLAEGRRLSPADRAAAGRFLRGVLVEGLEPHRPAVTCFACEGAGRPALSRTGSTCAHCEGTGTVPSFWPRIVRSWSSDDAFGRPVRRHRLGDGATYVRVTPHGRQHRGRSYLGLLVGEVPLSVAVGIDPSGGMRVAPAGYNPAIYVFCLGEVLYGMESAWSPVARAADLEGLAENEKASAWYRHALATLPPRAA